MPLTRKSLGNPAGIRPIRDSWVVMMYTYQNEQQRQPAGPDSKARGQVYEIPISQIGMESWSARRQARSTAKHVDVCLIEDDESIVGMVEVLLEPVGINLVSVGSCEGAITALREIRPRLLLVDLGLPDRSGLEIARVVRGWNDYPYIPIIALTASAERAGAAWRAGFSGFIAKPFEPKMFQTMVKSWVSALTH
jgi:CheY-like chemotaxis protein